jgi:hypothetical protein
VPSSKSDDVKVCAPSSNLTWDLVGMSEAWELVGEMRTDGKAHAEHNYSIEGWLCCEKTSGKLCLSSSGSRYTLHLNLLSEGAISAGFRDLKLLLHSLTFRACRCLSREATSASFHGYAFLDVLNLGLLGVGSD